jgi:hypothetical protein
MSSAPGSRQLKNFHRRFGNPPRITINFVPVTDPAERRFRSEKFAEAYRVMLDELLGRPATDAEFFGEVKIDGA